jgi:hypothetical protein
VHRAWVRRRWSNTRKTKRALIQQFLVCVASQAVTIDDFTSDVSTIARDAVALCKAEAHTAAVSNAGSHNELVPGFRASLEKSSNPSSASLTNALLIHGIWGWIRPLQFLELRSRNLTLELIISGTPTNPPQLTQLPVPRLSGRWFSVRG